MSTAEPELECNRQHGRPPGNAGVAADDSSDGRRLVVTGGRKWKDERYVFRVCDTYHDRWPVGVVIHGNAPGLDTLVNRWALARAIPIEAYLAQWDTQPNAGPERNQRMIDEGHPTHALIFPGGSGTRDMTRRIVAHKIPYELAHLLIDLPY